MKLKIKRFFYFLLCVAASCSTLLYSCKEDSPSVSVEQGTSTTVNGFVKDIMGNPIASAEVICGTSTTISKSDGSFSLYGVVFLKGRCFIKAFKQGYFTGYTWVNQIGTASANTLVTLETGEQQSLNANTGGSIALAGGGEIVFQASSLEDKNGAAYDGEATIITTYLNPEEESFNQRIPGGNLLAKNKQGNDIILYSFGMMRVDIIDNVGNELKLKTGAKATLKFPIVPSQIANAPATIPLWHFDEEEGVWKEEGVAARNGHFFEGEVTHFSSWNVDESSDIGFIEGRILDCNNQPAKNVIIKIGQTVVLSADDGTFRIPTLANMEMEGLLELPFNSGFKKIFTVTLKPNETFKIGTIKTDCFAAITGYIEDCDEEPFSGKVSFVWKDSTFTDYEIYNGFFSIPTPYDGSNVIIKIFSHYTGKENKILTVSLPTTVSSKNIGVISACNTSLTYYYHKATFNGDGYTNTTYKIPSTDAGFYDNSVTYHKQGDVNTMRQLIFSHPINTFIADMWFSGSAIKTVDFSNTDSSNTLWLHTEKAIYKPISGTLKILQYGVWGGKPFEAEFGGTFGRYDANGNLLATMQVTNGKIIQARAPDRP